MTAKNNKTPAEGIGTITLVGAGPGDPDLITVAGMKALRSADVVVYDRLINTGLLGYAPDAEHIYLGKEPGQGHHALQPKINAMLIEHALRGRRVVRLKGGDPHIFGRGGEECAAARERGIPVRVIPGVTASLGAAAASGIPLTHRECASSVAFVTGCMAADNERGTDWAALARGVDTIVIYMGVRQLPEIGQAMIEAGRRAEQPVAAIHEATLPGQTIEIFTLREMAAGMLEERIKPPSVIIIGDVVAHRGRVESLLEMASARGG